MITKNEFENICIKKLNGKVSFHKAPISCEVADKTDIAFYPISKNFMVENDLTQITITKPDVKFNEETGDLELKRGATTIKVDENGIVWGDVF